MCIGYRCTFVNRIAHADEAIVHEMRGVTRDRSYHEADWNGVDFKLIDTGGIEMGDDDAFQGSIRNQALAGANEADVILFLVDGKTGVNADDEAVARILRKTSKPVFLVVNKLDTPNRMDEVWELSLIHIKIATIVDEVPVLALVAAHARGVTVFREVSELRVKETDRLAAIVEGLETLGVDAWIDGNDLFVDCLLYTSRCV